MPLHFLVLLAIQIGISILGRLLAGRQKRPKPQPFDVPKVEEGATIPKVYGVQQVSGLITHVGSLPDPPDESTTPKGQPVTYYYAKMQMVLCWGEVDWLYDIIADEKSLSLQQRSAKQSYGGNEPNVTSLPFPISHVGDGPARFRIACRQMFGGQEEEGGLQGEFALYWGTNDQPIDPLISELLVDHASAYPHVAHAIFGAATGHGIFHAGVKSDENFYWAANNPTPKSISFLIGCYPCQLIPKTDVGTGRVGLDANPAEILYDILTNRVYGAGWGVDRFNLPQWQAKAQEFKSRGVGLSCTLTSQTTIEDFIEEVQVHADCLVVTNPITGLIELKTLLGDYNPDTIPVLTAKNSRNFHQSGGTLAKTLNEVEVKYRKFISNNTNVVPDELARQSASFIAQLRGLGDIIGYYPIHYQSHGRNITAVSAWRVRAGVTTPLTVGLSYIFDAVDGTFSFTRTIPETELTDGDEIHIAYTSSTTYSGFIDASEKQQNLANWQITGNTRSEAYDYPWLTTSTLAREKAIRLRRTVTRDLPLYKFEVNRDIAHLTEGDVVKADEPKYRLSNEVIRITKISYGTLESPWIACEGIRDIWGEGLTLAQLQGPGTTPEPPPVPSTPPLVTVQCLGGAIRVGLLSQDSTYDIQLYRADSDPTAPGVSGGGPVSMSDGAKAADSATLGFSGFAGQRQGILDGIVSAQAEATGFNALKSLIPVTAVVRTSPTVVTITLPPIPPYHITAPETLTATAPGAAQSSGSPIVATPTFAIQAGTDLCVDGAKGSDVGSIVGPQHVTAHDGAKASDADGSAPVPPDPILIATLIGTLPGTTTAYDDPQTVGVTKWYAARLIRDGVNGPLSPWVSCTASATPPSPPTCVLPIVTDAGSTVEGVGTLTLVITDPQGRRLLLEYRERSGDGVFSDWHAETVLTDTVDVPVGLTSRIEWRVTYTDCAGRTGLLSDGMEFVAPPDITPPTTGLTVLEVPVTLITGAPPLALRNIPAAATPLTPWRGTEKTIPADGVVSAFVIASIERTSAPVGAGLAIQYQEPDDLVTWTFLDGLNGPLLPVDEDSLDVLDPEGATRTPKCWVVSGPAVLLLDTAAAGRLRYRGVIYGGTNTEDVVVSELTVWLKSSAPDEPGGENKEIPPEIPPTPSPCDDSGGVEGFENYISTVDLEGDWTLSQREWSGGVMILDPTGGYAGGAALKITTPGMTFGGHQGPTADRTLTGLPNGAARLSGRVRAAAGGGSGSKGPLQALIYAPAVSPTSVRGVTADGSISGWQTFDTVLTATITDGTLGLRVGWGGIAYFTPAAMEQWYDDLTLKVNGVTVPICGGGGSGSPGTPPQPVPPPPPGGYPPPPVGGDRPFGMFNIPAAGLGPLNITVKHCTPGNIVGLLNQAAAAGTHILVLPGSGVADWLDSSGKFQFELWCQAFLAIYNNATARAALEAAIISQVAWASWLVDEPFQRNPRYGGTIPLATVERMAQFSKAHYPTWPTIITCDLIDQAWWFTRHISGLDYVSSDYMLVRGDCATWKNRVLDRADDLGHTSVLGPHYRHFNSVQNGRPITVAELAHYGPIIFSAGGTGGDKRTAAAFGWKYDDVYWTNAFATELIHQRDIYAADDP